MSESKGTALVAHKARTGLGLSVPEMKTVAEYLARSGFFPDHLTVAQALAKIQAGQEVGIPPFAAMSGFHTVNGKPAASARLMGALIKKSGDYDYDVVETTEKQAVIEIWPIKDPKRKKKVTFTLKDAERADLLKGNNKETWRKYPEQMLFARCISKAITQHCPHLFYGSQVYTPEELDAKVDVDGDPVVDAEFEVIKDGEFGPGKEDLDRISKDQYDAMLKKASDVEANLESMRQFYCVPDLMVLSVCDWKDAMVKLNAKPSKKEGNKNAEVSGALSGQDQEVGNRESGVEQHTPVLLDVPPDSRSAGSGQSIE